MGLDHFGGNLAIPSTEFKTLAAELCEWLNEHPEWWVAGRDSATQIVPQTLTLHDLLAALEWEPRYESNPELVTGSAGTITAGDELAEDTTGCLTHIECIGERWRDAYEEHLRIFAKHVSRTCTLDCSVDQDGRSRYTLDRIGGVTETFGSVIYDSGDTAAYFEGVASLLDQLKKRMPVAVWESMPDLAEALQSLHERAETLRRLNA